MGLSVLSGRSPSGAAGSSSLSPIVCDTVASGSNCEGEPLPSFKDDDFFFLRRLDSASLSSSDCEKKICFQCHERKSEYETTSSDGVLSSELEWCRFLRFFLFSFLRFYQPTHRDIKQQDEFLESNFYSSLSFCSVIVTVRERGRVRLGQARESESIHHHTGHTAIILYLTLLRGLACFFTFFFCVQWINGCVRSIYVWFFLANLLFLE